MFKRIDHVEIIPRDFDASLSFYCDTFGFRVRQQMKVDAPPLEEVAYLELGDTVLELMKVSSCELEEWTPWSSGYKRIALEVEDMGEAVACLAEKGVGVTWGPYDLGDSKRAEVQDLDGLSIELREWCKR